jgi:hypothetical protein
VKIALGSRRQAAVLAFFAVVLVLAVVKWRGGPTPVPGPARPAVPTAPGEPGEESPAARARPRRGEKEVSPDKVPIVTSEDFQPPRATRDRAGRNIFDFRPPTPTPVPTPRPMPTLPPMQGPPPPPSPPPTPTPPEITFRFIGTFGPKDRPIAVLVSTDKVVNARAGDVVYDRFILRRVGYESIDVGFVGFSPSETRRVGITQ